MGSTIGHRIDDNGVGAPRDQRHVPSKNLAKYPPPPTHQLAHRCSQHASWSYISRSRTYYRLEQFNICTRSDMHSDLKLAVKQCQRGKPIDDF